ncbi:MAG: quinolinate synthase NadA [Thermoguttaceae bacterium]
MTLSNISEKIEHIRQSLGRKLLILGHHYQKTEVLDHTDLRGDSFQLSATAAENEDCESIVFCGVHFMAETADVLANRPERLDARNGKRVNVLLPDLSAGCSMADLAHINQVEQCWSELAKQIDVADIVPITYVNSSAAIKAFCGRNGGIACTSSNASAVLRWAFSQKSRVLFLPDQHLGRNTAFSMDIPESQMPVWNPDVPLGGNDLATIKDSRVILWNGYCCVHQFFTPEHVATVRAQYPGIRVIVHPECSREVVQAADLAGSTNFILEQIRQAKPGSIWGVGTEGRMVDRLGQMFPEQKIVHLGGSASLCETMDRTNLENLLATLESVESGNPKNIVQVDPLIAPDALLCLERMLATH